MTSIGREEDRRRKWTPCRPGTLPDRGPRHQTGSAVRPITPGRTRGAHIATPVRSR